MSYLYFAYGSNLDRRQMGHRCPGARLYGAGHLEDHKLAFTGHSHTWGGAVATVQPAPGQRTWGVVWELTPQDLGRLDGYEGHPRVYRRQEMTIQMRRGPILQAQVYLKEDQHKAWPSASYLEVIAAGYRRHGFDLVELDRALGFAS